MRKDHKFEMECNIIPEAAINREGFTDTLYLVKRRETKENVQ